jgi:hypothetical protein
MQFPCVLRCCGVEEKKSAEDGEHDRCHCVIRGYLCCDL